MRLAPAYINAALRRHDPFLSMEWCIKTCAWYYCWNGTQQFAYRHRDGKVAMVIDGCLSEILSVIQEADMKNHFLDKLKQMERKRARQQREREAYQVECSGEANQVTDWVKRDKQPKPFAQISNNPLAKETQ
jgi:hypothetical protein